MRANMDLAQNQRNGLMSTNTIVVLIVVLIILFGGGYTLFG